MTDKGSLHKLQCVTMINNVFQLIVDSRSIMLFPLHVLWFFLYWCDLYVTNVYFFFQQQNIIIKPLLNYLFVTDFKLTSNVARYLLYILKPFTFDMGSFEVSFVNCSDCFQLISYQEIIEYTYVLFSWSGNSILCVSRSSA